MLSIKINKVYTHKPRVIQYTADKNLDAPIFWKQVQGCDYKTKHYNFFFRDVKGCEMVVFIASYPQTYEFITDIPQL